MSKLDRALIGYDQLEDPRVLELTRGARLLHVEAITWSALHKTDGAVSKAALRRLTDEADAALAASSLVSAGLWQSTNTGWQIVEFLRDQMGAEQVARIREANRERQERWTQCRLGDHSKCRHNGVDNGVSNGVNNRRLLDSTRSDSTRLDAPSVHIEAIGREGQLDSGESAALCHECGEADAEGTWRGLPVCGPCHTALSEPLREAAFIGLQAAR